MPLTYRTIVHIVMSLENGLTRGEIISEPILSTMGRLQLYASDGTPGHDRKSLDQHFQFHYFR